MAKVEAPNMYCQVLQLSACLKAEQIPSLLLRVLPHPPTSPNGFRDSARELLQSDLISIIGHEPMAVTLQTAYNVASEETTVAVEIDRV